MEYTKIQGTGNDFIILDNRSMKYSMEELSNISKIVCTRKLSVGADGLIVVDKATAADDADFKMIFFNSDGSKAEMCGNGARCVARYAYENKLASDEMKIETPSGIVTAHRINEKVFKIRVNNPTLILPENTLIMDDSEINYSYVELGTPGIPHVIVQVNSINSIDKKQLYKTAKYLRNNKLFNKGANVTFYDIIDQGKAIIRTFERGVEDFTLACGTGASATAIIMFLKKQLKTPDVTLVTDGGELIVNIDADERKRVKNVYLIGETNMVSIGKILDENL